MSGLDRILDRIGGMAQESANDIIGKAQSEADTLIAKAKADAKAESARIAERAVKAEEDTIRRAHSTADLNKRRALLSAKQAIIGETIDKALACLSELPAEKYFEALIKLVTRYAMKGEGTICFNQKDLNRLPEGFEKALNAALGEGSSLKVSNESAGIDGGFVLKYGGIEENCSLSALFAANRESLQDIVQKILFP